MDAKRTVVSAKDTSVETTLWKLVTDVGLHAMGSYHGLGVTPHQALRVIDAVGFRKESF